MTIKDCIMTGVTTVTNLTEPYYARFYGTVDTEYVEPTNVHVESVAHPLQKENVKFDYHSYIKTNTRYSFGQFKWNTYYPVGSTVQLNGRTCTVISYGDCERSRYADNLYCVAIYVDATTPIEQRRITNEGIEDDVIRNLNTIMYANENIKNSLVYYNNSIIELIGNSLVDVKTATTVVESIHRWQQNIENGYQAQVNSVLDITPLDLENVYTQIMDYRKYYDYNTMTMDVDYMGLESLFSSKSFSAWLYNTSNLTNKPNYNLFKLPCIQGTQKYGDTYIHFTFNKLTTGTVVIVLYTPVGYNYNILIRFDPTTTVDQMYRLNPVFGVGKIAKNVTAGTTVDVEFKTVTASATDSWGNLASVLYMLQHATADVDYITYLNTVFEDFINAGTVIPAFNDAKFKRDVITSDYGRLGVLTIGTETIDI